MTETTAPRPGFRFTGWHFLAIIVGFFAIVVAVDSGFVVMAVKTFPGEVSATPYEDGLAYDRSYAQLRAQERLGWRATAAAEPGLVVLEMRDRAAERGEAEFQEHREYLTRRACATRRHSQCDLALKWPSGHSFVGRPVKSRSIIALPSNFTR